MRPYFTPGTTAPNRTMRLPDLTRRVLIADNINAARFSRADRPWYVDLQAQQQRQAVDRPRCPRTIHANRPRCREGDRQRRRRAVHPRTSGPSTSTTTVTEAEIHHTHNNYRREHTQAAQSDGRISGATLSLWTSDSHVGVHPPRRWPEPAASSRGGAAISIDHEREEAHSSSHAARTSPLTSTASTPSGKPVVGRCLRYHTQLLHDLRVHQG